MFISYSDFAKGVSVEVSNDPNDVVLVRIGYGGDAIRVFLSRNEALELYSGLEKVIHLTNKKENLCVGVQ